MRRVAVALAAASLLGLAGCDGAVGAEMTFDDTEKSKITDIVLAGGSADVMITTGAGTETRIKRVVRGATDPGRSYQISGAVLTLSSECGRDCHVSYEIQAPAGVAVRGDLRSGDVGLNRVGPVDLKMTSGDVFVENATGAVAIKGTSGDITIDGAPSVNLEMTSGDVNARGVTGAVNSRTGSGDTYLELTAAASVTASVTSGDLHVVVPAGSYQVRTDTGSGDEVVERGVVVDPKAKNTLDLRTRSGDLTVTTTPSGPAPERPEAPPAPDRPTPG